MHWRRFWADYVRLAGARWRESTRRHATSAGRLIWGETPLEALTPLWAARFSAGLVTSHGSQTAASYGRRLQAGLSWGHQVGQLPRLRLLLPAARAKPRGQAVTAAELAAALQRAEAFAGLPRVIRGLAASGLRLSELLALEYDREVCYRRGWLLELSADGKGHHVDLIPAPPELAELLERQRRGRVFPYPFGVITCGRQIRRCGIHAHDLRRAFALRWAERGLAPCELAKILRHRDSRTTAQYYTTVESERLRERMECLKTRSA